MIYELAKELKDAGFPQQYGEIGKWILPDESRVMVMRQEEYPDACYLPTLSELVEEIPARVKYLDGLINDAIFRMEKMLAVSGPFYRVMLDGDFESEKDAGKYSFTYSTPEEAVARLWLALNKK